MKLLVQLILSASLLSFSGCSCRRWTRYFDLYASTPQHSKRSPVTFTVINSYKYRHGGAEGRLHAPPELRPEYSEVYVFDQTQPCYAFTEESCPLVWKATTDSAESPWKITYGEEGKVLKTVHGPEELKAGQVYSISVALRRGRCIEHFGSHLFSIDTEGAVSSLTTDEGSDVMIHHYVPLPDSEVSDAEKDRLNRLATQYEKLNGHPLLPLSYGQEVPPEEDTRDSSSGVPKREAR